MKIKVELTQSNLKELLNYDESTGVFTWKKYRNQDARVGDIAGYDNNGYIQIGILCGVYMAHRLAWFYVYGVWPKEQIDHVNQIKTDNRICNLRDVDRFENCKNIPIGKANTSDILGVCWNKKNKSWSAVIGCNGESTYLGSSKGKFEACCLRKSAENKYGYHPNHGRQFNELKGVDDE